MTRSTKRSIAALVLVFIPGIFALPAQAQDKGAAEGAKPWLPSLITATPQQGFELAVALSRRGVRATQPDAGILHDLRTVYANDPDSLIAASSVVAIHFQTIAAANDYWRSSPPARD